MKRIAIGISMAALVFVAGVRVQTSAAKPGPKYQILYAWAGNWTIQGEAKDGPDPKTGPTKNEVFWSGWTT